MRKPSLASGASGRDGMKTAVFNIGKILTGDLVAPVAPGDTVVMAGGKLVSVGSGGDIADCDSPGASLTAQLLDRTEGIVFTTARERAACGLRSAGSHGYF